MKPEVQGKGTNFCQRTGAKFPGRVGYICSVKIWGSSLASEGVEETSQRFMIDTRS